MLPAVRLLVLCLAVSAACTVDVPLEGKACAPTPPECLSGYLCVEGRCLKADGARDGGDDAGTDGGSGVDGGPLICHLFDDTPPLRCSSRAERYLDPDGGDALDGLTPATAWASLTGHPLPLGARVHLAPGEYQRAVLDGLASSGTRVCPLEITGPADGGVAVLRVAVVFSNVSDLWLHDFELAPTGTASAVKLPFLDNIRLERLRFHATYSGGFPRDLESVGSNGLVVVGCTFESTNSELLNVDYGDLQFLGNVVVGQGGRLQVPEGAFLAGNDVSGHFAGPEVVSPWRDGGVIAVRNVFHDLIGQTGGALVVVPRAVEVRGNTFVNVASGVAASSGVFRDNLVSGLDRGSLLDAVQASAGYNLFDSVLTPYAAGAGVGDVSAVASFDPGFVPASGSAAIDAADPLRPVAFGGGARADIGAIERGAPLDAERRLCLDGGY